MRKSNLQPQIVLETNLLSLARSLVKRGLAVSAFLRIVVSDDPELAAVSFAPPLHLNLLIAWKADGYPSRADRAFVDFLKERVREF